MQYNDCAQQKVKEKNTFVGNEAGKLQSQKVNMRWGWMTGQQSIGIKYHMAIGQFYLS